MSNQKRFATGSQEMSTESEDLQCVSQRRRPQNIMTGIRNKTRKAKKVKDKNDNIMHKKQKKKMSLKCVQIRVFEASSPKTSAQPSQNLGNEEPPTKVYATLVDALYNIEDSERIELTSLPFPLIVKYLSQDESREISGEWKGQSFYYLMDNKAYLPSADFDLSDLNPDISVIYCLQIKDDTPELYKITRPSS